MPTLQLGARTLSYSDEGEGTPALLVHSGGLSSRQWRALVAQLKPRHRVLVPDLIGYGGSSPLEPGADYQFDEDVDSLEALLERAGGGAAHLVGHSYGGLLALQLALRNPEQARSLSLFEPVAFGLLHRPRAGGPRLDPEEAAAMEALAADPGGSGGDERWMERFVDWWQGAGMWRSLPAPSRASFLAAGRKTFLEVRSLLADRTPFAAYASIAAPALVLCGARSPATEQRVCAELARALPEARLVTLPTSGHMGPLTHAAEVNGLIASHLAEADSRVDRGAQTS